jgi:hypothetical protein
MKKIFYWTDSVTGKAAVVYAEEKKAACILRRYFEASTAPVPGVAYPEEAVPWEGGIIPEGIAGGASAKKTFYCVMSEFYADGTVKAGIKSVRRKEKPKDTSRKLYRMDAYNDWYGSYEEAAAALTGIRQASA